MIDPMEERRGVECDNIQGHIEPGIESGVAGKAAGGYIEAAVELCGAGEIDAHTPMVLVLQDGEEIEGTIEWYDRGALKINRRSAPNLLVLKRNIKYIFKAEERVPPTPVEDAVPHVVES